MAQPVQTTAVAEPTTTEARNIYRSGPVAESVVLINLGDALGEIEFSISRQGGKVDANAPTLPRGIPVPFRLAPDSYIVAVSTAGERSVAVIATPLDYEDSSEEELFNLRCLMEQLIKVMTTVADRMPIK